MNVVSNELTQMNWSQ